MTNISNRRHYLDILRIVSALMVITIHLTANFMTARIGSNAFIEPAVLNVLSRICIPLFFMTSGSLMLSKEYSIKSLAFRALKMLIIYILIGIYMNKHGLLQLSSNYKAFKDAFKHIFVAKDYRWFLIAISSLYLITPILKYIVDNKKLRKYFMLLLFLSGFALDTLVLLPQLSFLKDFIQGISLRSLYISHYCFYYCLGYILYEYLKEGNIKTKSVYLISVFLILSILRCYIFIHFSNKNNALYYPLLEYNRISNMINSVVVYILAYRYYKPSKLLSYVADRCLAVYIIHYFLLIRYMRLKITLHTLPLGFILVSVLMFILLVAFASIVHEIFKLLKSIKKKNA